MSERLTPIIIVGARGRMGKTLLREIAFSDSMILEAAVDRSGGPGLGQDAGRLAGLQDLGIEVTDELQPRRNSVVVDFSLPHATEVNLRRCVDAGVPLVLGTTGLQKSTRELLRAAAKDIAIVSAANFSVATSESWTDKSSGNAQERTEWHRITVYGKLADLCAQFLRKGSEAYIEGSIHTRTYDDKDGTKRSITEIKAQTVQFIGGRREDRQDAAPPPGNSRMGGTPQGAQRGAQGPVTAAER